jgi:hypothetical protein
LQVRRLNAPQGCPTVSPGAYNAAPAGALGSIRCRILDIATPVVYTIKPVDDENYQNYFALYHADGTRAESCGTVACTISTAGKYTLVVGGNGVNQVLDTDFQYALALLPAKATGCPGIATDPLALARHDGQFAAAGQYDCVQLDAAAGSKVALLQPTGSTGAGRPSGVVYDADGNYVCESPYPLRQESCELVGTAPFSYVYSAPDGAAAGPYSMQVLRVSGDSGCTVLPQATPTTVTSSAATYTACFSIPADQHAAKEIVTYQVTAGTGTASVALYNASGFRYCGSMLFEGTTRTMTCTLPAGAYTLLVQTAAADGAVQVSRQAAP